ncbi:50S ribosomal protein L5 [Verrucomicrobiota bacterium]
MTAATTLQSKYAEETVPRLKEQLGIANDLRVPRLSKIVVNMGVGVVDKDVLKAVVDDLAKVTGQRPVVTKAKHSISNFKLREGMPIGARVTLRGRRMFEFLERLVDASLPRIRDFRGLSPRGFDGRGNYTLGIREQSIFPEIDPNNMSATQGMDITLVTTGQDDDEGRALLKALGLPFAAK